MVDRSTAVGIVEEGRQTVAGGFAELDVALDDGLEDQSFEVGLNLFVDLIIEACTAIVHRHQEALYIELGIESLAHDTDGIEELRDPSRAKYSHCTGMSTESAATRALTVISPREGEQSMRM